MAGGTAVSPVHLRHSHGLEQFFASLGEEGGLQVLDLGEFTQANVSYITSLGHRLYAENFLHTLDHVFGTADPETTQADNDRVQYFLAQVLQYQPAQFDAVLVWDTLEHLSAPLLKIVLDRLHMLLRANAPLLACFHAESRDPVLPHFSYRIADGSTLAMQLKGRRRPVQRFNNRAIEKIFADFRSVKFFLTRDHLREVIVRR